MLNLNLNVSAFFCFLLVQDSMSSLELVDCLKVVTLEHSKFLSP